MRILPKAYLLVVLVAACWAIYIDLTLRHSEREHLLPDLVLFAVTLPSSLSISPLYEAWPSMFSLPFAQVGWAILCGLAQAFLLFVLVSRFFQPTKRRGSTSA
jgi:hypothetical protein